MFSLVNSEKFIKNINIPSCKTCIHYKPYLYTGEYSSLSRCEKFGEKDIITDELKYDYVDSCRKDESKCGHLGKFHEKDENTDLKYIYYAILANLPIGIITVLTFVSIIANIYYTLKNES
jgi:hypothetical protein